MDTNLDMGKYEDRQKFYQSKEWRALRKYKIELNPLCEICIPLGKLTEATQVHHKMALERFPTLGLDINNLQSLCHSCHSRITRAGTKNKPFVQGHIIRLYKLKKGV